MDELTARIATVPHFELTPAVTVRPATATSMATLLPIAHLQADEAGDVEDEGGLQETGGGAQSGRILEGAGGGCGARHRSGTERRRARPNTVDLRQIRHMV